MLPPEILIVIRKFQPSSKMRSRFLIAAVGLLGFAVPSHAYRMSAWVPSWDANALAIMQTQAGNLHEANPGWYTIAADGTFTRNYKAEDMSMRAALTGTQLVPTIKNYFGGRFDGEIVATIVGDPALREKHAEALAQLAVDKGLDGIDVDYESVPATARASFSAFVQILADKLHATRRVLSVTVHAKTSDGSTRNGPGAQDWRAIGAAADTVKIMAYDAHWSTSAAGAITPLDWLDQVAAYAESAIPAGKAIIGLPWYGYDWLEKKGSAVTYAEAVSIAQQEGAAIGRDASGEATFTYDGRTVFFQDAAAYRAKVELIGSKHPRIAGFAHWRVGAEDPAIWAIVRELKSDDEASIRTPPMNFAVDGPRELKVTAGSSAAAQYGYLAINGFNSNVTAMVKVVDAFGGTAALSTPTVTRTSNTTLTVTVPKSTPAGTYRVTVKMTGAGITREKVVTVTVAAARTYGKRRAVR
jgi:spore germination protein